MTNKTKNTDQPAPDFEAALKELESIVTKMEGSSLNLEQALQQFEQGVALARQCQLALSQAELRVQQLITENSAQSSDLLENED